MYHLHCSTCNLSGMEGKVYFACSKIVLEQVEWKPEWKAIIFYTLMYTYLARKRVACVEIHPLMYTYLVRKHVACVEWKVKSAYKPSGPSGQSLSQFP